MMRRTSGLILLVVGLVGCASHNVSGISASAPSNGAVVTGEGLGAGQFLKDIIPGADRIVGGKAPFEVDELSILKVNGKAVGPSKGDDYWFLPGTYEFDIECGFKDYEGNLLSGMGEVTVRLELGHRYKIQGSVHEAGKGFLGAPSYACDVHFDDAGT